MSMDTTTVMTIIITITITTIMIIITITTLMTMIITIIRIQQLKPEKCVRA